MDALVQDGDFIAADFDDDGVWDHMGFVTDVETSMTSGYYVAWTTSTTNNWETIGSNGGRYARVRR